MPAVAAAALIWRKTHPSDVRMPLRVITAALVALMLVPPGLAAQPARELFGAIHAPTSGPATPFGGYAKGCLAGAVQLPSDGPGWQARFADPRDLVLGAKGELYVVDQATARVRLVTP